MSIIRFFKCLAFAVAVIPAVSLSAETTMTVSYVDGSEPSVFSLTDNSKIMFGGFPSMSFSGISGTPESLPAAKVKRITFSGKWTSAEEVALDKTGIIKLKHNPVGDYLEILGACAPEGQRLDVFSIAGRHAVNIPAWKGEPVDVRDLPRGIYILRVGNHSLKFVKK